MKINKIIISFLLSGLVSLWGAAGVADSKHNLSATAWTGETNEDNGELCVYCHTPHASNTGFSGAPIWNKATPSTTFTLYGTTVAGTVAGKLGDGSTVNSPSMACLSCHDGVSAVNSVYNVPDSGAGDGFIGTGAQAIGDIDTNIITTIGTDLSNDHPVSITYDTAKAGLKATSTALTSWIGATTVADLLRDTAGVDYVECGSCHDPHNGLGTAAADTQVQFLRISNAGSALCLGCHAK